jgi:hypothetical protein
MSDDDETRDMAIDVAMDEICQVGDPSRANVQSVLRMFWDVAMNAALKRFEGEPVDPGILDLLERRYTPGDEQRCRECQRPMVYSSTTRWGFRVYVCTAPSREFERLTEWMHHRRRTELAIKAEPDPQVIALVEAYRALVSGEAVEGP